jgi:hypothetical protein
VLNFVTCKRDRPELRTGTAHGTSTDPRIFRISLALEVGHGKSTVACTGHLLLYVVGLMHWF